jgi:type 1 glutamine amidotransferase
MMSGTSVSDAGAISNLVIWPSRHLAIWPSGHLAIWSSGHLVIWSSGHLVNCLEVAYRRLAAFRALVAASLFATACTSPAAPRADTPPAQASAAGATQAVRVLMLTATAGFRHDSIPTAREVLTRLAPAAGFSVTATENLADVSATRLSATDVLMFALTTGELPFDDAQKRAITEFVANGGGFIGVHSAADTLYEWPDYGRLVGAYFKEHPWTQQATVLVEDRTHPTTSGLGAAFSLLDEFYTFRENPRPSVHVLLSLDPASVGAQGDFPLAWTQTIGRGRSYYSALGHFSETWNDPRFQNQIVSAIRWTAGR